MANDTKTIWAGILNRVGHEFTRGPLGTSGAVVAIADVAWRLAGEFVAPPSSAPMPTTQAPVEAALPTAIPFLEFAFFQILIVFLLSKLNFWASRLSASIKVSVGLLTALFAGFLTSLNAFHLARFYILSEGKHYTIFELFWLIALVVSIFLLIVLQTERDDFPTTAVDATASVVITVVPMAIIIFASCAFFDALFSDRLQAIWSAIINSSPRPH